ncbi:inactive serine protease 54-like [Sturnira hondurensis]|uniref:inactive serine protease 54-like n=1 Tax=Sturnira hondurensis TaxID=192404 RepID=UPI001879D2C3|nr:inactive serine protease 54-like [Sturnira hondurensis]
MAPQTGPCALFEARVGLEPVRCFPSCPWCLLRLCWGMAGTAWMLLVLLSVSDSVSRAAASCGVQKASIIEDSEEGLVSENEFPWVVSLQDSHHTHLAFGSILSEFWILSIASAFEHRPVHLPLGWHCPLGLDWGALFPAQLEAA